MCCGARHPRYPDGGEQLDNAFPDSTRLQKQGRIAPASFTAPYETANFSSLIALKSLTSPPTRLVA